MTNIPLVSVCMITYNHEPYVKQSIESILSQRTDFKVELVIGEDCSSDNTRKICEKYAKENDQIRLLPSENNIGMIPNFIRTLKACTGKYIAICEGDDYWTTSEKLQEQVDIAEMNKLSLCVHASEYIYQDGKTKIRKTFKRNRFVGLDKIILGGGELFATSSYLFRRDVIKNIPDWFYKVPVGDYYLTLLAVTQGLAYYINKPMSAYRCYVNNSWSSTVKGVEWYETFFDGHLQSLSEIREIVKDDSQYLIEKKKKSIVAKKIMFISKIDRKKAIKLFMENLPTIPIKYSIIIIKKLIIG